MKHYFCKKLYLNDEQDPFLEVGMIVVNYEDKFPMSFQLISYNTISTLHSTKLDTHLDFYNKMLLVKKEISSFVSFLKDVKIKDKNVYSTKTFLNRHDVVSNGYIACYYGKSLYSDSETEMDAIVSIGDCIKVCRIVKNDTIQLYIKRLKNIIKLIEFYEDYVNNEFVMKYDESINKMNLLPKGDV